MGQDDDNTCLASIHGNPCSPEEWGCLGCGSWKKNDVKGKKEDEYHICDPSDKKDNPERISVIACSDTNDFVSNRNWLCSNDDGKASETLDRPARS